MPVALPTEAASFRAAKPFEHLVWDGFLPEPLRRRLLAEAPAAGRLELLAGPLGDRRTTRDIAALGPAHAELDALLSSAALLSRLSALAGTKLVRNPNPSCGGLFVDPHGGGWDPHLDANCQFAGHRRRLVLILYVNDRWDADWGGELELYADPRRAPAARLLPLPGRAVAFACHDRAWHGVAPIALPPKRRALGRRAVIVNYYGAEKPGERPPHFNWWLPHPLPRALKAGRRLTPALAREVEGALRRRDALLTSLRELAPQPWRPAADLSGLAEDVKPGAVVKAAQAARWRRAAAVGDRELRKLYELEYGWRRLALCASR